MKFYITNEYVLIVLSLFPYVVSRSRVGTGGQGGELPPNISGVGGGGQCPPIFLVWGEGGNAPPIFQCTPNEFVLYIVHTIAYVTHYEKIDHFAIKHLSRNGNRKLGGCYLFRFFSKLFLNHYVLSNNLLNFAEI